MASTSTATLKGEVVLISSSELAKMLSVSVVTIRRLCDEGKVPGLVRLGRSVRFQKNVCIDWINTGCQSPALQMPTRKGGNK